MMLAGAQLGASKDVILPSNWEPDIGADPEVDLDALRTGPAARFAGIDDYAEIFDPYGDTQATPFRLSDDLAAVAADLIHGLKHHEAGRVAEALVVVAVLLREPLGHARRCRAARAAFRRRARQAGRR